MSETPPMLESENNHAANQLIMAQILLAQNQSQNLPQIELFRQLIQQFQNANRSNEVPKIISPPINSKTMISEQLQHLPTTPTKCENTKTTKTASKSKLDKKPTRQYIRTKRARKLNPDEEVVESPVSGMHIRTAHSIDTLLQSTRTYGNETSDSEDDADLLDETAKWVEVTDEARAQLAMITNVIGDYICQLCKIRYADAFKLAKHRCPRIVHEEYKCTECDKVFSCPANLASHRRWHKPKDGAGLCTICSSHPHDDLKCRSMLLQQVKKMKK